IFLDISENLCILQVIASEGAPFMDLMDGAPLFVFIRFFCKSAGISAFTGRRAACGYSIRKEILRS
ncbi:MAG TPA: hypothetical protein IAA07_04910, partial [Candidatus Lachnoclostridium stercoravium]|nr:hypothetical protein [Candidatus Lachnoclostridium stercoravium]